MIKTKLFSEFILLFNRIMYNQHRNLFYTFGIFNVQSGMYFYNTMKCRFYDNNYD